MQTATKVTNLSEIFELIKNEKLFLPRFQRKYVWNKKQIVSLLDSLVKGYAIGAVIFWESDGKYHDNKDEKDQWLIKESNNNLDTYKYILDGQQRLTTLFVMLNANTTWGNKYNKILDLNDVYLKIIPGQKNYENECEISIETISNAEKDENQILIPFKDILKPIQSNESEWNEWVNNYSYIQNNTKTKFSSKLRDIIIEKVFGKLSKEKIKIPVTTLYAFNFENAIDQFTKLNTGGKPLTTFEIFSANYYQNQKSKSKVLNEIENILKISKLDTDKKSITDMKKIITNLFCLVKSYVSNNCDLDRLSLNKSYIVMMGKDDCKIVEEIFKAIKNTCEYIKNEMQLSSILKLPYTHSFVLLAFIQKFGLGFDKKLSFVTHKDLINKFIILTGMFHRYDKSASQELIKDIKAIVLFKKDEGIYSLLDSPEKFNNFLILNSNYKKNIASNRAIEIFYKLYTKPLDWETAEPVSFDCVQSKKENFDHIFPHSKYKKLVNVNSYANIAIVTSKTNIEKTNLEPSQYFQKIKTLCDKYYCDVLASQYINDACQDFIKNNNAEEFWDERSKFIYEDIREVCINWIKNQI